MNSAAAGKTFIKMQSQLLKDDDCACFLVEAIAKASDILADTTKGLNRAEQQLMK